VYWSTDKFVITRYSLSFWFFFYHCRVLQFHLRYKLFSLTFLNFCQLYGKFNHFLLRHHRTLQLPRDYPRQFIELRHNLITSFCLQSTSSDKLQISFEIIKPYKTCTFDMTYWNDLGVLAKHHICEYFCDTLYTQNDMSCWSLFSKNSFCLTYFTVWYIISAVDCVRIYRQVKQ